MLHTAARVEIWFEGLAFPLHPPQGLDMHGQNLEMCQVYLVMEFCDRGTIQVRSWDCCGSSLARPQA